MNNLFKQPIFIGFLVVAVIGAFIWNYADLFKKKKAETTTETAQTQNVKISNLTNLTASDFDPMIKREQTVANQKALEQNKDNKIAGVVINIGSNLLPTSVVTRYVYNSAADKTNNWVITFSTDSSSYLRSVVPKEDYLGDLKQFDTNLWKYNYVTALQLAEKNGGQAWRETHSDFSGAKLTLKILGENNWLEWIVEYTSPSANFMIYLDANSGKVVTN